MWPVRDSCWELIRTNLVKVAVVRIIVVCSIVATLLAPTLLCAIPAAPMNASEADCCAQMAQDCGKANMSACCTTGASNGAFVMAMLPKKSQALARPILEHAVDAGPEFIPGHSVVADHGVERLGVSPPGLHTPNPIQVLRI